MSTADSWNSETVYATADPLRILSLGSSGTLARAVLTFPPSSKPSRSIFFSFGWEGMEVWLETACRRYEAAFACSISCKVGRSEDSTLNAICRKSGMVGEEEDAMYWRTL